MSVKNEKVNIIVGAKDKTGGILKSIQGQVVAIGAAYLGFSAVKGLLTDIVNAGKEHERIWTGVEASLQRHGLQVDMNIKKIRDFSDEMQTLSGVSDEVIGDSVRMFVDYGNSVDKSMSLVTTAMDLATGANINYKSAVDLLAKASTGYTSMLSRYGIIVDQSLSSSEKFNEALKQINERFGGATQAQAETYAVKIEVLKQRFGDLEEELFKLVSPALTDAVSFMADVVGELLESFEPEPIISVDRELAKFNSTSESTTEKMRQLNEQYKQGKLALEDYGEAFANAMNDLQQIQAEELNPLEIHDKELKQRFEQLIKALQGELAKGVISYDEFNKRLLQGLNAVSGQLSTFTYTNTAELLKLANEAKDSAQGIIVAHADAIKQLAVLSKERSDMLSVALAYDESQEEDHWDSVVEIDRKAQEIRLEAYRLGIEEIGVIRLEALEKEYQDRIYYDELLLEQAKVQTALRLNISVSALEEILDAEQQAYEEKKRYIEQYTRRLESDFRSTIHSIVNDTDKGINSMKQLWNNLGKSVRSIIVDVIIDAIVAQISSIFAGVIPALIAEGVAVKTLTREYNALAVAKAFSNPASVPAMIAGGTAVKASLEALQGFDDPLNDAVARRHGYDYAREFMEGQQQFFGAPGYANRVVAMQPERAFASQGNNVTINIGNVDSEDRIEQIKEAIRSLDSNLTGSLAIGDR